MKYVRETLAASTAVVLIAGCSAPKKHIESAPTPQVSSSAATPEIGRNTWPSSLRYIGRGAKYLLAINCETDPSKELSGNISWNEKTNSPDYNPQSISEALTVGATDEQGSTDEHDPAKTANFLGGMTIRRYDRDSLEYVRSDDKPGYADTARGGGSNEYIPIPGKPYKLTVGVDPESGTITLSCEPSAVNPVPDITPTTTAPSVL